MDPREGLGTILARSKKHAGELFLYILTIPHGRPFYILGIIPEEGITERSEGLIFCGKQCTEQPDPPSSTRFQKGVMVINIYPKPLYANQSPDDIEQQMFIGNDECDGAGILPKTYYILADDIGEKSKTDFLEEIGLTLKSKDAIEILEGRLNILKVCIREEYKRRKGGGVVDDSHDTVLLAWELERNQLKAILESIATLKDY